MRSVKIDDLLAAVKTQLSELFGDVGSTGITPVSLKSFEIRLVAIVGDLGKSVEARMLEAQDVDRPHIDIGGKRHYRKYRGPQEYESFLGKIKVERTVYQANGAGEVTLCPLELNAGIHYHHLTPLAAEFVAYSCAHMVPAELAEFCRRWQFLKPCETVIKHVASEVGEDCEVDADSYMDEIHREEGEFPAETKVVAVSRDGVHVNVRKEGWRQAQVGTVSAYDGKGERLETAYIGQMPEYRSTRFNEKLDWEVTNAVEKLPPRAKLVFIADGAKSNWKYQEEHALLRGAVPILDFWHAAQYLSKAAKALFGAGSDKASRWVSKYTEVLKSTEGGHSKVVRSIRYHRQQMKSRSKKRLDKIKGVLRYFSSNRERMNYATYRRQKLPIGSGVVEAGCKTLATARLKRAGMRWSIEGGQHILNLRALVLSRRWDCFWRAHENALAGVRVAA